MSPIQKIFKVVSGTLTGLTLTILSYYTYNTSIQIITVLALLIAGIWLAKTKYRLFGTGLLIAFGFVLITIVVGIIILSGLH